MSETSIERIALIKTMAWEYAKMPHDNAVNTAKEQLKNEYAQYKSIQAAKALLSSEIGSQMLTVQKKGIRSPDMMQATENVANMAKAYGALDNDAQKTRELVTAVGTTAAAVGVAVAAMAAESALHFSVTGMRRDFLRSLVNKFF